jgi:hypothetical protein
MPASEVGTLARTRTPETGSDARIPIGWKGPLAPLDKLSGDRPVLAPPTASGVYGHSRFR